MTEAEVIGILAARAGEARGSVRLGIGDDAAVLTPGPDEDWVVTQDALVEDVHFRRRWMDPESLGWKVMAVSLSDLAAMGAHPRAAFLTLALPDDLGGDWISAFANGVGRCLERFGAVLAGGDTVRSLGALFMDACLIGVVPRGRAVARSTGRPGDRLVVTGSVGAAALGLRLLEDARVPDAVSGATGTSGNRADRAEANRIEDARNRARTRQTRPVPRVLAGQMLAPFASAMADLSDGLAGAVHALCDASGTGASLDASCIPIDEAVRVLTQDHGRPALDLALWGGEDYELLAAVPPDRLSELPVDLGNVGWTEIGLLTPQDKGRTLHRDGMDELLSTGYDAFIGRKAHP